MWALQLFIFASLALFCSATPVSAPRACIADYGTANGNIQPCSPVSVFWMNGLARNCTDGDLAGAYIALAEYCEDTRRENASLEPANMDRSLDHAPADYASRVIMRRPSSQQVHSSPDTPTLEESTVEPQRWQSSSSSLKHLSWAWKSSAIDGFSFSNLFAERSVRFAISGLLFTTMTSFLFL